jgi:hypothetical protein
MDGKRFDNLSRGLAARLTRRRVVATALGLAAAAIAGGDVAEAANRTCRVLNQKCVRNSNCCSNNCITSRAVRRTERNRCGCPIGMTRCGDACLDTQNDQNNCGACGNVCENYGPCVSGVCPQACEYFQYDGTNYEAQCIIKQDGSEYQSCDHLGGGSNEMVCDTDADCQLLPSCGVVGVGGLRSAVECMCVKSFTRSNGYSDTSNFGERGQCFSNYHCLIELENGVCDRNCDPTY